MAWPGFPNSLMRMARTFGAAWFRDGGFFESDLESFDVLVISAPPQTKKFKLCESWSGALSYVVLQAETFGTKIVDLQTNMIACAYKGTGLSIGLPIKKLPNIMSALTTRGRWNDFEAPGWMLADDFEGDATIQSASAATATKI